MGGGVGDCERGRNFLKSQRRDSWCNERIKSSRVDGAMIQRDRNTEENTDPPTQVPRNI